MVFTCFVIVEQIIIFLEKLQSLNAETGMGVLKFITTC